MFCSKRALAILYSGRKAGAGEEQKREGPPWVIIAFTVKLVLGLIASQVSAITLSHSTYHVWQEVVEMLTMACLSFIMMNVGYEFDLDKSNMKQYGKDFIIAMAAAGLPALFVALWFMFALPDPLPFSLASLAGLFAAPTSAGILFSMLEAAGLKETWLFGKARVLAVFDDLGTLLLLVPLKILVSGFKWELTIEVGLVFLMLGVAYWKLHAVPLRSSWRWTALYAVLVTAWCKLVHYVTDEHIAMEAIEMEVLLPAFTLGCITRVAHAAEDHSQDAEHGSNTSAPTSAAEFEEKIKTGISMVFMMLVGLSMPSLFGGSSHRTDPSAHHAGGHGADPSAHHSSGHGSDAHGSDHDHATGQLLGPGMLIFHVFMVTVLMIVGKMLPTACYKKEADLRTRFALSLGMCPRGEVGAGVIVISLGLGMQGSSVTVAVLSLAVNLMLSSVFIMMVKRLLRQSAASDPKSAERKAEGTMAASTHVPESSDGQLSKEVSSDSVISDNLEIVSDEGEMPQDPQTIKQKKMDACEPELSPSARAGKDYPTLLGRNPAPEVPFSV